MKLFKPSYQMVFDLIAQDNPEFKEMGIELNEDTVRIIGNPVAGTYPTKDPLVKHNTKLKISMRDNKTILGYREVTYNRLPFARNFLNLTTAQMTMDIPKYTPQVASDILTEFNNQFGYSFFDKNIVLSKYGSYFPADVTLNLSTSRLDITIHHYNYAWIPGSVSQVGLHFKKTRLKLSDALTNRSLGRLSLSDNIISGAGDDGLKSVFHEVWGMDFTDTPISDIYNKTYYTKSSSSFVASKVEEVNEFLNSLIPGLKLNAFLSRGASTNYGASQFLTTDGFCNSVLGSHNINRNFERMLILEGPTQPTLRLIQPTWFHAGNDPTGLIAPEGWNANFVIFHYNA